MMKNGAFALKEQKRLLTADRGQLVALKIVKPGVVGFDPPPVQVIRMSL